MDRMISGENRQAQRSIKGIVSIRLYPVFPVNPVYWLLALLLCAVSAGAQGRKAPPKAVSPWDIEAREYLGTPASERAVERGLAWLASRQKSDGRWEGADQRHEVALTGLGLMAFLAAGHQPGRGRYGIVLNEAVDFLLSRVRLDGYMGAPGLIRDKSQGSPPMYGHGFATLGLSEVYGMTRRRDIKPKLEAAVRLIENTQNQNGDPRLDGGWRYDPRQGDADISVTVVQLLALRGAKNAGIRVSQTTIDRAVSYIKRCSNRYDGGFNYMVGQQQSATPRTGGGLLSLYMAGLGRSDEAQNAIAFLRSRPLSRNIGYYQEHFFYGIYYVTQAMYQAGGVYWREWFPQVRDLLVRVQTENGSWRSNIGYTESAGAEYATTMAILVLQVPAGLLPIYQK